MNVLDPIFLSRIVSKFFASVPPTPPRDLKKV